MASVPACINRIGTAVPAHEVHRVFVGWAQAQLAGERTRPLFDRMVQRAGIEQRWSVLPPVAGASQTVGGFYADGMPSTGERMTVYAETAPVLALQAIAALGELGQISHVVVASCTGFVAPGIDQIIARALDLPRNIERVMIGFMGCYAAVVALRTAQHIVRSQPDARVLVVTVELTTLHLQATSEVEPLLAMLQFGDGAAAAIVSAEAAGLELTRFTSTAVPDSDDLIRWTIGDEGFVMYLAGAVPRRIGEALADGETRRAILGSVPIDAWAVHAGGRSVLDAVERTLDLPAAALADSRAVLAENGNMSSATLMFVLARMLAGPPIANGVGMAFGPGLSAEAFGFRTAA